MNLIIDIGNSSAKLAVIEKNTILKKITCTGKSITNNVKRAYLLSDPEKEIKFIRKEVDLALLLPKTAPDKINSVIVLDINGFPDIVYAPKLITNQDIFIDTLLVSLLSNSFNSEVRFTTDGTAPNKNSDVYKIPFLLSETTFVKACAFRDGKRVSPYTERYFIRDYAADRKINGLKYSYYEGKCENLPDFGKLTPLKEGKTFNVVLDNFTATEEYYGIQFTGEIKISETGIYEFYLSSNDGSQFYIDDNLLIDNDGLHGTIEKPGKIKLLPGRHKIKLIYFQAGGKATLELLMSGSSGEKGPIPVSMLFPAD